MELQTDNMLSASCEIYLTISAHLMLYITISSYLSHHLFTSSFLLALNSQETLTSASVLSVVAMKTG